MDDIKPDKREIQLSIEWHRHNRGLYGPNDGLYGKKVEQKKMTELLLFRMTRTGHWRSFGVFRGSPELANDDFSGSR